MYFEIAFKLISGATEIPMFSYIPAEQYDDPPYEFLKAQILLMNSQQLMDKVARKADKTSVGCPFKDLDRRQQELYAIKLMEIESNT